MTRRFLCRSFEIVGGCSFLLGGGEVVEKARKRESGIFIDSNSRGKRKACYRFILVSTYLYIYSFPNPLPFQHSYPRPSYVHTYSSPPPHLSILFPPISRLYYRVPRYLYYIIYITPHATKEPPPPPAFFPRLQKKPLPILSVSLLWFFLFLLASLDWI